MEFSILFPLLFMCGINASEISDAYEKAGAQGLD